MEKKEKGFTLDEAFDFLKEDTAEYLRQQQEGKNHSFINATEIGKYVIKDNEIILRKAVEHHVGVILNGG